MLLFDFFKRLQNYSFFDLTVIIYVKIRSKSEKRIIFALKTDSPVYLSRLFLMNYRNVEQADLLLSPKINCFVGSNGMGKTNILDAIHYLSFCKSSVNPVDSQIVRHGADCMFLQGSYVFDMDMNVDISCTLKTGSRKLFRRNGKDYRRFSDHIGLIPLVMISPDDGGLISEGSEGRRRFMDVVISQYDHEYLGHLIDYNKALVQRNTLLKLETEPDADQFVMWESMMDRCARTIHDRRRAFVGNLIPVFQRIYSQIGSENEKVGLDYRSHLERGPLAGQLASWRTKERAVGYTLHGIHKDDLEMTLDGYPIKREGSQGQNKSYLIALKLAQYLCLTEACSGRKPLLLLDDLFDKLDSSRVGRILKMVSGDDFGQIFITDVDRNHLDSIIGMLERDFRIYTIENGEIR